MSTDAAFNFTWAVRNLPRGPAGAEQTAKVVRALAVRDSKSPEVWRLARELTRAEIPYDRLGEVAAVHRFVRDEVRYVRDVFFAETVQSPRLTLRMRCGDCDDKTGLAASLLYAIGYRVRYVLAPTMPAKPTVFTHIYPEVDVGGRWFAVETIVPGVSLGWKVKATGALRLIQ